MSFVGLHIHSDYSLLDGASQLPELIDRVVELGMPAVAITDHGVMYGAIELLKVCKGKGVKPIIGNEMYVINGDITKQERRPKYHQVVLAKNKQGYKNLVKLTTLSHLKGYQGKGIFARPCINKDLLVQYREGLMVTSACLGGEVPQAILQGRPEIARERAGWYKETFGDDYYLELQDHGSQEDRIVNVEIVKIARELDIKLICTNDSHYISCFDVEAHDALLCIQTGKLITEEKRLRYSGTEYLKSTDEMRRLFRDHLTEDVIEEAIANTLEVADKVEEYNILGEPRIPDYPVPPGYTTADYFEEMARKGLVDRFDCQSYAEIKPEYQERLDYELQMMHQMGFDAYFLVVWDYIKFARDHGIPVGPGRGSAAGSLVAYALGITNIDPVHHGLLFERFLNPERKSMPDIDTDFCIDRRGEVIQYVTEKYGTERVAQIITYNRMASKAVLKDVARVLNIPYGESDRMTKMIPVFRGKPTKLKVMISDGTPAPEFKEKYDKEMVVPGTEPPVTYRRWIDMAMRIEGTNKATGVHAAGVVISAEPLDEIVPLEMSKEGGAVTQYPMEDIEALGLLKMDFLGLKNLTMIQKTVDLVKTNHGIEVDLDRLPLDDPKSYQLLAKGELEGIFQLESSGMRQIVRDLKPSGLEDISSVLALYRPGPLDAGLIPLFINRKHGREKIEYQHPLLEPILQETYAVLVYQEQIMKIAQDLAGYTLGEADILRRCLSGSTQVVDAETGRLVTLAEIADRSTHWIGKKIYSLDLKTQKTTQQPIVAVFDNGVRDVWEITTKTNRKIKATQDHLFYTVLGWKPLEQFKQGDRIGLSRHLPITHTSSISDAQIKLSAYLIGDGHLSTRHPANSYFCNSDPALIQDFNRCAEELFGAPAPTDEQLHPGRASVTYARVGLLKPFQRWVDAHLKRSHSRDKEIPDWVLTLSKQQLQLFLGTLWSTDGSFDLAIGHTDYTSTSETLIRQLQHLLLRLGIVGLFNVKKIQYNGKPHYSYRVQVTGREDMLKFCELIQPYLSSAKWEKSQHCCQVVQAKTKNQSKHTIPPEIIQLIADMKAATGMTWTEIDQAVGAGRGTMSSGLNFQKAPTRSLARHRVQNFASAFQDATLMAIADSDVFWDEIVTIEPVGQERVFDLTIPETHNFIANDFIAHNCMGKKKPAEMQKQREIFLEGSIKNGIKSQIAEELFEQMVKFAEYCFNKSHSTAYGYVTYQTAYLKANYPVEYMAALLTANSGDQDKVQKYIATCYSMGIMVEPPDINRSGFDFTPLTDTILFGLSAVRNAGEGAIEYILKAREESGKFTSLADLCDRIDPRTVNRRALEALIQCGAMDSIDPNRKQLVDDLEYVLDWAQSRAKDRAVGQGNLFDLLGGMGDSASPTSKFETAPKAPLTEDYPPQEKLKLEKELLGFYISDHPLKSIHQAAKVLAPINLSDLGEKPDSVMLSAIVMISTLKPVMTKKGDRMAILQIEDLTGQAEAVVFPKAFERIGHLLLVDARLMVWGKVDRRDDRNQFVIEDAEAIEAVRMVMVELEARLAGDVVKQHELRTILLDQRGGDDQGKIPVIAVVTGQERRELVRLGVQFRIPDPEAAVSALMQAGFRARATSLTAS